MPAQVPAAVQALGGLHDVLLRVAPQQKGRPREIMIAISNYNLWPIGALPLWLKVCSLSSMRSAVGKQAIMEILESITTSCWP